MRRLWTRITERIDAATLRERVFIFAALVALLVTLVDALLIGSEFDAQNRLRREIAQRQTESAALRDQLTRLLGAQQADPDRVARERVAQLGARIAQAEARVAELQRSFTTPEQMSAVLEEMLGRSRKVTLVQMATLAASAVSDSGAAGSAQAGAAPKGAVESASRPKPGPEGAVFRHGVEITVAGSYLDLLAYVTELEKLPTQLYWGGAELKADAYPLVTLKLKVFTLSLDKAWMSV